MPAPPVGRGPAVLAAIALVLSCVAAAPARPRPPVELFESVPLESGLGNPELRSATEVWLETIGEARRSIDLEEFYLSSWPGEPLERVLKALGEAAKRGVRVRLILDAGMHRTYPLPADSLARRPGFAVRLIDMKGHGGGIQHAKYFLVDDEVTVLGSQNLDWRSLTHIHELGVRVRDPRLARQFARVYDGDWAVARPVDGAPETPTTPAVAATATPVLPLVIVQAPGDTVRLWPSWSPKTFIPDTTLWDLPALVRLIDGARRELVAQVLQYGVDERGGRETTLDAALRRAAARGVMVRLIVSDWARGGRGMAALRGLDSLAGAEVRLSTVPEWSRGYIPFARVEHCKYAVADGVALWLGTSNWEPGYFFASRNLAVTMENAPLAGQARRTFEVSWTAPGALPIARDTTTVPKRHGEEPPPGVRKVGG